MNISEACKEIIRRSDEDFVDSAYHIGRARSHFISSIYALLSNPESLLSEGDFGGLSGLLRLLEDGIEKPGVPVRERNYCLPHEIEKILDSSGGESIFRILGVYSDPDNGYCDVVFCPDDASFHNFIGNPFVLYRNTIYVTLMNNKIVAYPPVHSRSVFVRYLKHFDENDSCFAGGLYGGFSERFVRAAIDLAVVGFSKEVFGNG